jgi:hypothetical protein
MFVPMMWSVWSLFVVVTAALYVYRTSLTRDEAGQIFLDDSFSQEAAQQSVISAKVAKIEPLLNVARWMVIALTVFVIAYYVREILLQLSIL